MMSNRLITVPNLASFTSPLFIDLNDVGDDEDNDLIMTQQQQEGFFSERELNSVGGSDDNDSDDSDDPNDKDYEHDEDTTDDEAEFSDNISMLTSETLKTSPEVDQVSELELDDFISEKTDNSDGDQVSELESSPSKKRKLQSNVTKKIKQNEEENYLGPYTIPMNRILQTIFGFDKKDLKLLKDVTSKSLIKEELQQDGDVSKTLAAMEPSSKAGEEWEKRLEEDKNNQWKSLSDKYSKLKEFSLYHMKYHRVKEALDNNAELKQKFGEVHTIEEEDEVDSIFWIEIGGKPYVDKPSIRKILKKKQLKDPPGVCYEVTRGSFMKLFPKRDHSSSKKITFIGVNEARTEYHHAIPLLDKCKIDSTNLELIEKVPKKKSTPPKKKQ